MKKTIIAAAILTTGAAAFAQVSVNGSLAYGYLATRSTGTNATNIPLLGLNNVPAVAGSNAGGMGVNTSEISVTAKEDLGAGHKVEAKMGLAGADRSGESTSAAGQTSNGAVTGRDAILTYTNPSAGRFQFGTTRPGAEHSGIPSAGAPVIDMDGKLFQLRSNSDFVSYAVPIGPLFFELKQTESSNGLGEGVGSEGAAGTSVGQRSTDYALAYIKGSVKVVGAYRSYDNRNSTNIATAEGLTKDSVYALQLGYDAGFANFGFGYNAITATVGPKVQNMLAGVSVPYGSWTFGATYAMAITSGVADAPASVFPGGGAAALFKQGMQRADGTATGFSVGAQYDLSKNTNILMRHASWTRSGYEQFEAWGARAAAGQAVQGLTEFGYGDRASETSIYLVHNF